MAEEWIREVDVAIVGGGPAGSSCARRLVAAGLSCLVLDRAPFPRPKLCAGWITPTALEDLALDPKTYPGSFLTFEDLRLHLRPLSHRRRSRQHSIRRVELDAWALARSGAETVTHNVRTITTADAGYLIDDRYRSRWPVGAGGTACPVYRTLFRHAHERPATAQAAVLEEEFAYDWQDEACHLWFFRKGLPGYSWYVPKAGGHLNIGVGGLATRLQARQESIGQHWDQLTGDLDAAGLVRNHAWAAGGYTYHCRALGETLQIDRALSCGDAAGLASRDMFEGFGPAIRSGLLAADAIIDGRPYDLGAIDPCSRPSLCPHGIVHRALRTMMGDVRV